MTHVLFNNLRKGLPGDTQTLGDLLGYAKQNWVPEGEVITNVVLNGKELSLEEESDSLGSRLMEMNNLELQSADPRKLAFEGMEDAVKYLPFLIDGFSRVAMLLRVGNLKDAYEILPKAIEGLDWFVSLIRLGLDHWPDAWRMAPMEGDGDMRHALDDLERILPRLEKFLKESNWILFPASSSSSSSPS